MNNKINKNEYIKQLSKMIFWDLNINKLDYKQDKQKIIERIAVYGNDNDIKLMFEMYNKRVIKKALKNANYLNSNTISYFALILNIREKSFKCYGKKLPHLI